MQFVVFSRVHVGGLDSAPPACYLVYLELGWLCKVWGFDAEKG